jgi:hypothetical protein
LPRRFSGLRCGSVQNSGSMARAMGAPWDAVNELIDGIWGVVL